MADNPFPPACAKGPRLQPIVRIGLLTLVLLAQPHSAQRVLAAPAVSAGVPSASGAEVNAHADRTGFIWPVRGPVTSRFGSPRPFGWHRGVDIKAPAGTPIRAAAPGAVVFSGRQSSYGRMITIAHPNGLSTVYAHNSANFVKAGDPVKTGMVIGAVGRTGRATTNHLHFEIRRRDVAKNPLPLLQPPQPSPRWVKPRDVRAAVHDAPTSKPKVARTSSTGG
jgi:murein DD-endopeptidase MepM/ murein hydrolase activator NlpD